MMVPGAKKGNEDIRSSGTGVTNSGALPCGDWESNLGPLEVRPALLSAETSLQPPNILFKLFLKIDSL